MTLLKAITSIMIGGGIGLMTGLIFSTLTYRSIARGMVEHYTFSVAAAVSACALSMALMQ